MKQAKLFTPGPTVVPARVLETQARALIHHRSEAFRRVHRDVLRDLGRLMETKNPVVVLSSSGSGAMEAALANTTRPGDTVIATVCGKFSGRWADIAKAFGMKVVAVEAEWGTPVQPAAVVRAFEKHPEATTLLTTHSETSTGVLQNVEAFAGIAHDHGALVVVDGITSLGAHHVQTDVWGLDVLIGGAQKGVMVPPGLAYLSLSAAAIERMAGGHHPCYYFDLESAVEAARKGDTPYTPAITLVVALREALRMIHEEGLDNVIRRHEANASAVRAAAAAMGLDLFASVPSNATTVVVESAGCAGDIIGAMENDYGVKVAGGQARLAGKIIRLGHLGYYDASDMLIMVSALECALDDLGVARRPFGAGVAALHRAYGEFAS